MSGRSDAIQKIADFINDRGYNSPFGGDVSKSSNGRTHYVTMFAIPRFLDGTVQLWSEKFILVRAVGPLAPGGDFSGVYESVDNAIAAISCLCEGSESLEAIPVRKNQ